MEFVASLTILLLLMTVAGAWLLMPILFPIYALGERKYEWLALSWTLANIIQVAFASTLMAQLARDFTRRNPDWSPYVPWLVALLLQVFFFEASIDKRKQVISDASRYMSSPKDDPRLRYWRVGYLAVLPAYLMFLYEPRANLPFLYEWYAKGIHWVFESGPLGAVILGLAALFGALILFGSLRFAAIRIFEAITRVPEEDRIP